MISSLAVLVLFLFKSCAGTTNYTYTWTEPDLPHLTGWQAVSCGQDGVHCVASQYYGDYSRYKTSLNFMSSDGGATWKQSTSQNITMTNLYSSVSGQYVFSDSGYFSSDYGDNFAYIESIPNGAYTAAMSLDATILYVVDNSTDYTVRKGEAKEGQPGSWSWTTLSVPTGEASHRYLSCSGDGQYVLVGDYSGALYSSSDFGVTWTLNTAASSEGYNVTQVVISPDGSTSYITVYYRKTGGVFPMISRDHGATWGYTGMGAQLSTPGFTTNRDGSMIAISQSDAYGLWISNDYLEDFEKSEMDYVNGIGPAWVSPDGSKIIAAAGEYTSDRGYWSLQVGEGTLVQQQGK